MSLSSNNSNDPFDDFFDSTWAIFDPFRRERNAQNRAISSSNRQQQQNQLWAPRVDIKENGNEIIIHADLPGMKKEDVQLELHDDILTLNGERKEEKKEQNEKYHRVERTYGKFQRRVGLPSGIDASKISAGFQDGVLEIKIKKPEQAQPKKIEIN